MIRISRERQYLKGKITAPTDGPSKEAMFQIPMSMHILSLSGPEVNSPNKGIIPSVFPPSAQIFINRFFLQFFLKSCNSSVLFLLRLEL